MSHASSTGRPSRRNRQTKRSRASLLHAEALGDISPEQRLIAAVIACAVDDAMDGDAEAVEFLEGEVCRSWLSVIAPSDFDVDAVLSQLLSEIKEGAE